jgi:hypothetical protein
VTIEDLNRADLLARLLHWNNRLEALGAAPLVTLGEADDLTEARLRRVVDATLNHMCDVLQYARR